MYAVIQASGRQWVVREGDTVKLNRLSGSIGDKITFDRVSLIGGDKIKVGTPFVSGATVVGTISAHEKAEKVTIFKYKRRKNYRRTRGHRQGISTVTISGIHS